MDTIPPAIKRSLQQRSSNYLLLLMGLLLVGVSIWLIGVYLQFYSDRAFPKTYIDDINVSGLTQAEIREKIQQQLTQSPVEIQDLRLFYGEQELVVNREDAGFKHNLDEVIVEVFAKQTQSHRSLTVKQIVYQHFYPRNYELKLDYLESAIDLALGKLESTINQPGKKPRAEISGDTITIDPGETAVQLDLALSKEKIHQQLLDKRLRQIQPTDFQIELITSQPITQLTEIETMTSLERARKFLGQEVTLSYEYQKIRLQTEDLLKLLAFPEGVDEQHLQQLIDTISQQVNRPSQNAAFDYDPETLQVLRFTPDLDGLEIDQVKLKELLLTTLATIEQKPTTDGLTTPQIHELALPMQSKKAETTLEQTNSLGIKEVIGFGESWYDHSIPNRIHNVAITTERISNHIVKPGAEFSFNQALGEVSARTGYRDAYIIEAGQTKLSPGGGVCQVSSTLFRSLLDAGVTISKRLPHAYRVSYYEINNEPGFDATVYAGEVDLRFINDTPGHILINCHSDSEALYMNCKLYGTSDGRSNEITAYRKWGQSAPLPTVYIDDPSLRPGQLRQIDWSASGIKTEFTNIIRDKNGKVIREDRYQSNYRPWAAKYLRGI